MTHTFVMLAYKESPFLGQALQSLSMQTVQSDTIIATSTPNEHIHAEARRFGLQVSVNPARRNIACDWNYALSLAPSRYVTLAHQDDLYEPEFAAVSRELLTDGDCAIAFTGYQEINDEGSPVASKISFVKHAIESLCLGNSARVSGGRLRAFLSFGNPLPCSSVTYDLERLKDFQFSGEYASNLDWDAWWRLMKAGETFARTSRRLVGRRHNKLTATSALIASGAREAEDRAMFRRAWPRPVADIIASAYRAGY